MEREGERFCSEPGPRWGAVSSRATKTGEHQRFISKQEPNRIRKYIRAHTYTCIYIYIYM